jgi:FdhD protein
MTDLASRTEWVRRLAAGGTPKEEPDEIAVEEPLELRIEGHSVAVMMRTPGYDRELAAGFLLTENLIRRPSDIFEITLCGATDDDQVVNVTLRDPTAFDPDRLTRNVFSSSSCGVCSKATLAAIRQTYPAIVDDAVVARSVLETLPDALRRNQQTFERTGGLHACGLFDLIGNLELLREDVGRHNALDKLIGHGLLASRLPARGRVLFLSGRVSFEMMQKALAAGISIVAAISAPTSFAVDFARANNQTLVGFIRGQTMNVYAGADRVDSLG